MSNLNVEDCRQPSDTDSQWQLKKEFIEMYKYIFDKEKLLCLAQACCDIILKKSRYPDPVVKVITELSKPLKICERLLRNNGNPSVKRPINEHQKDSDEINSLYKHSERPFKRMKFLANEEQPNSPFLSTSTISQSSVQHFDKTYPVPLCNEQNAQIYSKSEQVLKTPVEHSEKSCKQMNFSANEGQTISAFLSTLTDRPSGKQFSSTHSKPLYNEQGAQSFAKSEQVLKTPVEHSEKSCKQMNFSANEGKTISEFLSTLTDRPLGKQFSSTHSKPLYNEQGAQSFAKSEQVLKTPAEHSEKSCKQMNFSANEAQTISAFLSTLTDRLQPSVKQFSNPHSKPLYNEQGAQSFSKSEQVLKTPVENSEKSCKQMNFSANEGQTISTFLSTLTDRLQPSAKQFSSTHSKPLYSEQGAQSFSKSEQVLKTPVEISEKSSKQMNFSANEGQTISTFLSTLTDRLQPSAKQFSSTHSKPLYSEQGAQSFSKSEQVLKTPVEISEKSSKQMNFSANEGQTISTFLSTLTDRLQPSAKQFSSTHSKPLYSEQGAQSFSKSEQVLKTPVEISEKSSKQMNFSANEGQTISTFLSTLTDRLQPSAKQFSSTHSKPLYSEQGAQSFSKSEQVLKTPVEISEKSSKQMNFSANEGQTISTFLSTLTDRLQPSAKQFSSTHSKPLYSEQGAQSFSKSEQVLKTPVEISEKSSKQMNFSANEGQTISTFLSTLTDRLQPSAKQFSSTHSKPLYSEQGAQSFSKSEQVLKTPVEISEKSSKQMNFSANEGQTISTFLSTLTDRLQPSAKQFSSTHSKPLYSEQGAQSFSKSEQVLKTPVEISEKSSKQMNFSANEGQTISTFLSTLTDRLQPSAKQFSSTHSKPLYSEQGAQSFSKSEQVLKTPVEFSEKSSKQMNFSANEGQTISTFLSTLTDRLQPSAKQFSSTHSKPLYSEQGAQSFSKSEQVLKTPVEISEKSCKQMNFSANEGQTISTFLSTLTDRLQPSAKQFSSTHSKPLYSEQGAQSFSKSEQVLKTPVEISEKSSKQMNFSANEGQTISTFLSTLTDRLQPSVKQFSSTHSKPLYSEQGAQSFSKSEQVLKTPVENSEKSCKQMNFSANEGQAISTFLSTLTDRLQPSGKQFSSTHSKPLYSEQGARSSTISEQTFNRPAEYPEKSFKQKNFCDDERQFNQTMLSTFTDVFFPLVEQFRNISSVVLSNEQGFQSLSKSEKAFKAPIEHSEVPFKQMGFWANKKQSTSSFLPSSTNLLQPLVEQFKNIHSVSSYNEKSSLSLSKLEQNLKVPAEDFERPQKQINLSGIKELLGSTVLPTQGAQSLSKSEKAFKATIEHSEGSFKQMDFWANKKEPTSSFLPSSTNLLQPSVEQFKNTHPISSYNEKSSLSLSKLEQTLKVPAEDFERPQKQINLSGIKELLGSTLLPTLTNGLQSSKEQFTNTYPVPLSNEQEAQILSKSEEAVKTPDLLSNDEGVQILSKSEEVVRTASIGFKEPKSTFQVKDISIPKENEDRIIKALGLPFIKEFADVVTGYGHKCTNPLDVIHYASRRCNFRGEYRFETDSDRDISTKFYSKFFLKDCLVASVTAFAKKEARLLAAEAGINTLVKLATDERSSFSSNPVEKPKHSIDRITDSEKVFEMFSRNINRANDEPAIVTLKNIASLLDMEDYLAFNVTSDIVSETETEYTCKFFLNDVFVSYATDEAIQNAKDVAAELGLIKLTNLAEYEINKSELRHKNKSVHSVTYYPSKAKNDLGKPFIINKALFDSSMRDGMVFLERDRYKISPQKFLKNKVSETAIFCRKDFSLKAENPVSNSPYRKCVVSIGGKEVGVGVSFRPDNAKTIACTKAYIHLKRKYYTLKFKDDCMEGFLVTRDQLFNRQPYYRNVIKKDFIKCTKLKTNFWLIDISKKDIGNCIESKTKQTSSKGTGYEPGRKPKIRDYRQFTDRLEPMLKRFKESQDYCDLLFSYEFTPKERGLIIKMVQKVGLRFQVLINDKDRIVCVRHKYEVRKLLNYLVRHGGYNSKFELVDESETVI